MALTNIEDTSLICVRFAFSSDEMHEYHQLMFHRELGRPSLSPLEDQISLNQVGDGIECATMHPVLAKKLAVGQPILVVVAAIQIALKHIKWVFSGSSGNRIPRLPQDLKTVCELGYQHKTSVG
jgi:hypothetical protein